MKQTRLIKMLVGGAVCAVALTTVLAQDESSTTTTTTTAGATGVSEHELNNVERLGNNHGLHARFRLHQLPQRDVSVETVKYYYTRARLWWIPKGQTVEWSMLKPDMPVTYTYVKEGDRMVITKVTLTKPFPSIKGKLRQQRRQLPNELFVS